MQPIPYVFFQSLPQSVSSQGKLIIQFDFDLPHFDAENKASLRGERVRLSSRIYNHAFGFDAWLISLV
jgi:hypothetical protein